MFSRLLSRKDKKKGKELVLVVEDKLSADKPFLVNLPKRLLVENSAIFKKMYEKGEFKKCREVKLEGVTVTGLEKVVEFITKDSVSFQTHNEAIDTLKAAYLYQITVLYGACEDYLTSTIDLSNVCEIFEFAADYGFHDVEYHCLKFIDKYAEDVLKSPGFLTLKKATVMDLIKRSTLNVESEYLVFKSVLVWGLNECLRRGLDPDESGKEFFESVRSLMGRVRFQVMSDQELRDPEVDRFFRLVHHEDPASKRRSMLSTAVDFEETSGTRSPLNITVNSGESHDIYSSSGSPSNRLGSLIASSEDPHSFRRSFLDMSNPEPAPSEDLLQDPKSSLLVRSRSNTMDSVSLQPRSYQEEYEYHLDVHGTDDHPVRIGESFSLKIEVLKGRMFLAGVSLVFDTFVTTKNWACLYVNATATNVRTCEQRCSRGTFLNTSEEAELRLTGPLVARECDVVEVTLNVKRAENICPVVFRSEVQIAMPDTREVAMKVIPGNLTCENVRSLFKSVKYFF